MDIYYSIRIIYCNIPLLIKLILGGFNHEAKKVMLGCVNAMAMMLVVQTANSACVWIVHQPEFPEVAKRYSVSND